MIIVSNSYSQSKRNFFGTYIGLSKNGFQKLIINADSTFLYNYRDKLAHLAGSTIGGNWKTVKNKLILNSDFKITDYTVKESKIENTDTVSISVRNKKNKPIWFFSRVILNQDTSMQGVFLCSVKSKIYCDTSICKIRSTKAIEISIHNNFYTFFNYKTKNIFANDFEIIGNFSEDNWYRYFENEKFKIKKNKLKGSRRYRYFTKIN